MVIISRGISREEVQEVVNDRPCGSSAAQSAECSDKAGDVGCVLGGGFSALNCVASSGLGFVYAAARVVPSHGLLVSDNCFCG